LDFILKERKEATAILDPINMFTVGMKWEIFEKKIRSYVEFLESKQKSFGETEQKGKKKYATNEERLYAIQILCPDFINSLDKSKLSKKQKGEILSLITNVNPVDCYKGTFTAAQGEVDWEFKKKINEYLLNIK
jgi:hypothetical protein